MIPLPKLSKSPRGSDPLNPYNGRWRQWYVDIADWMIAHPGGNMTECARDLGRHYNTICFITRSDIFRDYYSQRRAEFSARTDEAMRAKLTGVAMKSLDVLQEQLNKKGDQIPMKLVTELAVGALDRLGYAPETPGTSVSINTGTQVVNQVTVSAEALVEARDAMRKAEERRAIEHREAPRVVGADVVRSGAERDLGPPTLDLDPDSEYDDGGSVSG